MTTLTMERTITFDPGGDAYTILEGTLNPNGHPGNCLDGGNDGCNTYAVMQVDLPVISTVTRVQVDWWKLHAFWLNIGIYIDLYDRDDNLLSRIGQVYDDIEGQVWYTHDSGPVSVPGVSYVRFWLHSSCGDMLLGRLDNCHIEFTPGNPDAPNHDGPSQCPINYEGNDSVSSPHPISLRDGEKRLSETDLVLNTPAGALALTRAYRQTKQADTQFMGLGWTHSHRMWVEIVSGTPDKAIVHLATGGQAHFSETSPGSDIYAGDPGSNSTLEWDSGASQYTLTALDRSTFVFDASGNLVSRAWPSGETWTYTYASGRLSEVDDGYGRELKFAYYSTADYKNGQLWRVGDQTASGLDGGSPSGRYVEYDYLPEKSDGQVITNPKALLSSVRDARGNTWTYDYYGQHSGQTDTARLNFLTEQISPSVDLTGDGTSDGPIVLNRLDYTLSGGTITAINQQRGIIGQNDSLEETDFAFQPGSENITTETIAGKITTHRFFNGVYGGPEDPAGNFGYRLLGDNYRPIGQVDANQNLTQLAWSTDGGHLDGVTDALGNETSFDYNGDDTLNFSLDAEGRKTQYIYGDTNNPRQPTEVKLIDTNGTTVLRWQKLTYDSQGRTLSEEVLDPSDGVTVQRRTSRAYYTSGASNGLLQTVTQQDLLVPANDVTTTYFYDSAGRVAQTNQSAAFGSCTRSYTVYDAAGNVVANICNYENAGSPPATAEEAAALYDPDYPDQNHVTTYEYDTLGRKVKTVSNAGSSFEQASLTAYDGLGRVVRTIRSYVEDEAVPNPFTADRDDFDHGPDETRNLVSDTAYNERGLVRREVDVLGVVTLYGYDDAGRLVKTIRGAGQPDYDNSYGAQGDPDLGGYVVSEEPDEDVVTTQQYDAAGNLVRQVDAAGRVSFTVYDTLNRPVKTVRSAKAGARIDLDPGDPGYDAANDPRSEDYDFSTEPDLDLVELTEYDAMGRTVRTRRLVEGRGPAPVWDVTLTGYDALGRVVKTIRSAGQPEYDLAADPDLSGYTASQDPDLDIVSLTAYDDQGRVLYSQDVSGQRAWQGYDGLGRVVKSIANAVGTATDGGASDPRSESYVLSTDPDRDLVTRTVYDADGRVRYTVDVLGRKTWQIYDDLGRVVKTIQNCTYSSGTPAPEDEDYAGSSQPDEDVITRTLYDGQGWVFASVDRLGNQTRYQYDELGRRTLTIANYSNGVFDPERPDLDRVSAVAYDLAGRVVRALDPSGVETRSEYDGLGRRVRQIANYKDGIFDPDKPDEDVTSQTVYDKAGQVVAAIDPRGTRTAFTYDAAGRRLVTTRADGTPLAVTGYTCYDKAGRVLRTIEGWWIEDPEQPSPDAQDEQGDWLFEPQTHGRQNDRNRVTATTLDALGRAVVTTGPLGNETEIVYGKDGTVQSTTDPLGVATLYRYDLLRRRTLTVQAYQSNGEDPALWEWDDSDSRYEESDGTPIAHGADNDRNVIMRVTYDKAGRSLSRRDSRGNLTAYDYDGLDRRTDLTLLPGHPTLERSWQTAYANLPAGDGTRVTLLDPMGNETERDFDRLGRPLAIRYLDEAPKVTPDVTFGYDRAGSRVAMSEWDGSSLLRQTRYGYDPLRRLASVGFDDDGDGAVEQTVAYQYDSGGLRTKLTMPDGLEVSYQYNQAGQLVRLSDWAQQGTGYAYDMAGRLIAAERSNGLRSRYKYDSAGRLRLLRHSRQDRTLGHFAYQLDARGNRVQVLEAVPQAEAGETTLLHGDPAVRKVGSWATVGDFAQTTGLGARLEVACFGDELVLTLGTGPDHGICQVYLNHGFWQAFDGYTAQAGEREITIELEGEGPHLLEIRNTGQKSLASSGCKLRVKQLVANRLYDLRTIQYQYDALSHLLEADYFPGENLAAVAFRQYGYAYDLAGNRTQQVVTLSGTPATTNYSYNALDQLTGDGTHSYGYDANGNLVQTDSSTTHSYDRANRLLGFGGIGYVYNGEGQRLSQAASGSVKQYLLDLQPELWKVLMETENTDTTRYVHGPLGLQSQQQPDSGWVFPVGDALGSVRGVVDNDLLVLESHQYEPYGSPFGLTGESQTEFGFTGESYDSSGLLYLRARYYNAGIGRFFQMDSSLQERNTYLYTASNPVMFTDPSGYLSQVDCAQWPTHLRLQDLCKRANVANDDLDALAAREEIYRTFVALGIYAWMLPVHGGDSFLAASAMLSHFLDGEGSTKRASPDLAFINDLGVVRVTRGFGGPVGPDANQAPNKDDPKTLLPLLVVYIRYIQSQITGQETRVFSGTTFDYKSAQYAPPNSAPRARAMGYWAAYGHLKEITSNFTSQVEFDCRTNGYLMDYKARIAIEDKYEWISGRRTPFFVPQRIEVPHDWALSLVNANPARADTYHYTMEWPEEGTVWISSDFSTYKFIREPYQGSKPDPWQLKDDIPDS